METRNMGRKPSDDFQNLTPFAHWLVTSLDARGTNLKRVSDATGIDYSYLFKVKRSHLPKYAQYQRPGFLYTERLGEHLGDKKGALLAAGYTAASDDAKPDEQQPDIVGEIKRLQAGVDELAHRMRPTVSEQPGSYRLPEGDASEDERVDEIIRVLGYSDDMLTPQKRKSLGNRIRGMIAQTGGALETREQAEARFKAEESRAKEGRKR